MRLLTRLPERKLTLGCTRIAVPDEKFLPILAAHFAAEAIASPLPEEQRRALIFERGPIRKVTVTGRLI